MLRSFAPRFVRKIPTLLGQQTCVFSPENLANKQLKKEAKTRKSLTC